jgi:hypothetical protein
MLHCTIYTGEYLKHAKSGRLYWELTDHYSRGVKSMGFMFYNTRTEAIWVLKQDICEKMGTEDIVFSFKNKTPRLTVFY